MNKAKVTKALHELLQEDESLKYALATNLAKYGRPQSKKSDKPASLTKGLEKGREKYVKDLKKAGLDEASPVPVGLNMDQTDAIYKILEDNFGEEHMKDMFTLGSLSFYNMMVKGGIAGVFKEGNLNEDKDMLNKIADMLDRKYPHLKFDVDTTRDRIDVSGDSQDVFTFGEELEGQKIFDYEVLSIDKEGRQYTVRIVRSDSIGGNAMEEEKADRCLRIARREIPQSSAYRSGLIVKCRKGMIWKDKK